MELKQRKLLLEDGTEYCGYGFGSEKDKLLEQNREKSRQKQIEKNQYKKQR